MSANAQTPARALVLTPDESERFSIIGGGMRVLVDFGEALGASIFVSPPIVR